ncbi:phage tail tube protein [Corynebacterium flavescens]|uniref:phage tail tube protein n=1 Tax=Corynebacterium flavescens TaxID=28028 RepID=UPI0028A22997|nr:hypothetical protein [Corynebacterium flavescens]
MRNRANVLVGAPDVKSAGGVLVGPAAPAKTLYPKDAQEAVSEIQSRLSLKPGGFLTEDGVSKTVDRSTDKIKDWNGDTVVIVQSDHAVTLKTTFMESANAEVLKIVAGDSNVSISADGKNITVIDNADELPHRFLDFEIKGSAQNRIRVFAPDAQATEVGDVNFVRSGVIQYEVTFECFPDEDGNKAYQHIYKADGQAEDSGSGSGEGEGGQG